jgi:hypothetical protein
MVTFFAGATIAEGVGEGVAEGVGEGVAEGVGAGASAFKITFGAE